MPSHQRRPTTSPRPAPGRDDSARSTAATGSPGNAFAAAQLAEGGQARAAGAKGRPTGTFQLLGQDFDTLQALHDWLQAQAATPGSSVPHEPVLRIQVTPGSLVHLRHQTTWTYYNPGQKVVLEGRGAVVSGLRGGERPTPGYFLAYRPAVGTDTTEKAPAAANFELRGLTVRGYEAGGVEISPQTVAHPDNPFEGGRTAHLSGAVLQGNRFEQLGSRHTKPGQARWGDGVHSAQRFGVGGVVARGLSDSWFVDNDFSHLENGAVEGAEYGPKLIHAVYLRDQSSENHVVGNRFAHVSGDPVRICNDSNGNEIRGNRSRDAGHRSLVNEFYKPAAAEADSHGHEILGNRVGSLYGRRRKARRFTEHRSKGARPTGA